MRSSAWRRDSEWVGVLLVGVAPNSRRSLLGMRFLLPCVRRFFRDPGPWVSAGNAGNPDAPLAVTADLAWRELFVLYHLPGVAVIETAWTVLRARHSLGSVEAIMAVTAGVYAAALRLFSTLL